MADSSARTVAVTRNRADGRRDRPVLAETGCAVTVWNRTAQKSQVLAELDGITTVDTVGDAWDSAEGFEKFVQAFDSAGSRSVLIGALTKNLADGVAAGYGDQALAVLANLYQIRQPFSLSSNRINTRDLLGCTCRRASSDSDSQPQR